MNVYLAGPLFTPYERGFLDRCAAALRADGIDVFVPHEQEPVGAAAGARAIFELDLAGLEAANAVLALLDGTQVDDGTACEIGIFHALARSDPSKRGTVGLLTDFRAEAGAGHRLNLFVRGCIESTGGIHDSLESAVAELVRWRDA